MTRARALVVAYNFPPNAVVGTMRTLRLVEQLAAEERWDVTVLTARLDTHLPHEPVDPALSARVPAGTRVVTAPVWRPIDAATRAIRRVVPKSGTGPTSAGESPSRTAAPASASAPPLRSLPRRLVDFVDTVTSIPDSEAGWIVPAVIRGVRVGPRPQVLYSTAPSWSTQVIGYALARYWGCRWVADFRDPWSRGPWRHDRPALTMGAWRRMERLVVERADAVVFNTRRAHAEFADFYGPRVAEKLYVVPNGCDIGEFQGVTPTEGDTFVLLHAGSLYGGRSPEVLLQAIAAAIGRGALDRARFRLRLLGAQADAATERLVRQHQLDGVVEFAPRVPRRQSLDQIASASALLLLQQGHALSVPAKTYEYLAVGRPILALTDDGETATVVRESGVGVVASAADVPAVEAALLRVVELARQGVTRPPSRLFDGAERARELASLLWQVSASTGVSAAAVASPHGSQHA